ncbi:MAG: hypothetical protein HY400_04035, partial [Elusimicrobia bacterium]|nr:hypothetical protein [Elusimicrobiota bacterium]
MSDLSALAQEAVDWMRRQEPHLESEVYLVRGQERSLEIREGKLESLQERQYFGAGVRVLHEGRMGFAYTADLNTGSIQQLFKTVVCQLPYLPQDSFRKLPSPMQEPGARSQEPGLRETFWDDTLFSAPLLQKMDILKEMEVAALGVSPHVKRVLRLGYSEVSGEVTVANTLGISASERGTHCEVG